MMDVTQALTDLRGPLRLCIKNDEICIKNDEICI